MALARNNSASSAKKEKYRENIGDAQFPCRLLIGQVKQLGYWAVGFVAWVFM